MSRRWLLSLFCLAVPLLLLVPLTRARGALTVNEAATRFLLRAESPQVSLAVGNATGKSLDVNVQVELLAPDDHIRAVANLAFKLNAGSQKLLITLPIKIASLSSDEQEQLLWYRLRYHVTPAGPEDVAAAAGIVSLSEMTPDLFQVRVASARYVHAGMRYRATVRADHPLTHHPVRGVRLESTVEFDDDETNKKITLRARGLTDHDGFAVLDFDLPRQIKAEVLELTVVAQHNSLTVKESRGIDLDEQPYIFVTTDKPMYQPGQLLHARVLMFGAGRRAIANTTVTLKISDPENDTLFQKELTTSRFGVASADWPIPANTPLGRYRIQFETEDDKSSSASVKISRYDLPNFTVNVKPDRSFYLPNQNAEVAVAAGYLFGQPVKRGHVRIVRETERLWNYREQKYETKEGEKFEGETDASGVFKTKIDLSGEHAELGDHDYERFRDLSYAAYFTDPTTNRTEERRFDLRITREAIHLYVIKADSEYYESARLPLRFFVSASYADGAPAQCRVVISGGGQTDGEAGETLRTVKTNRYGLARVERLELPKNFRDGAERDLTLNLLATDTQGKTGKHAEGYYLKDHVALRVETDKTLYREGEPVTVTLTASERDLTTILEVVRDWVVVHSQIVRIRDGQATVTLPWNAEFKDELAISAFSDLGGEERAQASHTILYPRNRELKVGVFANHQTYRPGADAQVTFRVRDPRGRSTEGALGVVVFDKAVEERARTDQEFGSGAGASYGEMLRWLGNGDSISGIGRKELDQIDLSQPVAPDLELAAEIMLNQHRSYYPHIFGGGDYEGNQVRLFLEPIKRQLKQVRVALLARYERTREYPHDEPGLRRILSEAAIDYNTVRDPWGVPYRASFLVDGKTDVVSLTSAGADKRFDTSDDFIVERFTWYYFQATGEAIDRAAHDYHARTGKFIRDQQTLSEELERAGVKAGALLDRWSHPYNFNLFIAETRFQISVNSAGPNGKLESGYASDDFNLWTSAIDYFAEPRAQIDAALESWVRARHPFPQNEAELRKALQAVGVSLDGMRDPWGRSYYAVFSVGAFYVDRTKLEMRANYDEPAKARLEITPITLRKASVTLRSAGADGKEGTADEFTMASFSGTLSEQSASEIIPQKPGIETTFSGATGAIRGVVTDANGGVISGVKITATRATTEQKYETETDDEGRYILRNLPVGLYSIRFESNAGFRNYVIDSVAVRSSTVVELNPSMTVAAATEMVTVTADSGSASLSQSTTSSSVVENNFILVPGVVASKVQLATPRLREYFPETLVWQPSLETDRQGRAQINFKLADNITTWKLAVIGSTEDGQLGVVEKEFKAFQPFFVEHDPPRVLTEGDEISLPVVVRNYLERAQSVDLEIKPETWFALLGATHKRAEVAAGDAVRETFDLRAVGSVKDGKQRITTTGAEDNDAIEKPVTVHPDGEEQTTTASDIVGESATLELNLPSSVIPNSTQAEVKIYPDLLGHVTESVEAIMKRPYGCGEQTISSTYPSLLLLRHYKETHGIAQAKSGEGTAAAPALQNRAERYLREGYTRLLNYRDASGGFTYWGRGEPDLALTAYALRFLSDAGDLIEVDKDVPAGASGWLVKRQVADGSWQAHDYGSNVANLERTASLTAYVARVLAMIQRQNKAKGTANEKRALARAADQSTALKRALDYLSGRVNEIDEPYLLASYALASIDAGDAARAAPAVAKLRALAHVEGNTSYWTLETNTPFYGWGQAGRVETTALAVQALARSADTEPGAVATGSPVSLDSTAAGSASSEITNQNLTPPNKGTEAVSATRGSLNSLPTRQTNDALVRSGLLFLLKAKDRYGVWYSTQATINVLDAMLALLQTDRHVGSSSNSQTFAEIIVNGQVAQAVPMPAANQFGNPITVDVSRFLTAATNHIEIRRAANSAPASVQAVVTYYVPWLLSNGVKGAGARTGDSTGLRLIAKFDRTEGKVSNEITCHVEAERVGFHGYGMMLAEIGLPPGADVDRASLETAMKSSGWAMSQYDILPDRVVVYLWPPAGGVSFDFKFRPRFGLKAQTAPSLIYDYYNPDARAVVAPVLFAIK